MKLSKLFKLPAQKLYSKVNTGFDMSETITKFEQKYGQQIAAVAIVAIVTYLLIAQ
jgi:hypothetical protein